ncbi:MAG: sporulation integral membrane protein YtvI [Turicibacter sp.]|nr:sporulation integral membrane protein YtvI [Turicibacter sp.]
MLNWLEKDTVQPYARLILRVILTGIALIAAFLLIPVILSFVLPFVIAFLVAHMMNPVIVFIQKKINLPRGVLSIVLIVIVLSLLIAVLAWFIYALIMEVISLAQNAEEMVDYFSNVIANLSANFNWLLHYLPDDVEALMGDFMTGFLAWLQQIILNFADNILNSAVAATGAIGVVAISVIIFVMSAYFFMIDYQNISTKLKSFFSPQAYRGYSILKNATMSALGGYLRAQVFMSFITFLIVLTALLIIQNEFALLIAILLGLIDMIPVIGTSPILLPWAIISVISGDIMLGAYLFGLSAVTFVVRRVLEPKIVGNQMGLSPITALVSMYVGMRLGGLIGLVFGPIVAMILISLYKVGLFDGWVKDITAVLDLQKTKEVKVDSDD